MLADYFEHYKPNVSSLDSKHKTRNGNQGACDLETISI